MHKHILQLVANDMRVENVVLPLQVAVAHIGENLHFPGTEKELYELVAKYASTNMEEEQGGDAFIINLPPDNFQCRGEIKAETAKVVVRVRADADHPDVERTIDWVIVDIQVS